RVEESACGRTRRSCSDGEQVDTPLKRRALEEECRARLDTLRAATHGATRAPRTYGASARPGDRPCDSGRNNKEGDTNGDTTHSTTTDRGRARHGVSALSCIYRSGLAAVPAAGDRPRHPVPVPGVDEPRPGESRGAGPV